MPLGYRLRHRPPFRLHYSNATVIVEIVEKPSIVVRGHSDWVLQARKVGQPGTFGIHCDLLSRTALEHTLYRTGWVPGDDVAARIMDALVKIGMASNEPVRWK